MTIKYRIPLMPFIFLPLGFQESGGKIFIINVHNSRFIFVNSQKICIYVERQKNFSVDIAVCGRKRLIISTEEGRGL